LIINDIILLKKSKGGVLIEKILYSFSNFPLGFAHDWLRAEDSDYQVWSMDE